VFKSTDRSVHQREQDLGRARELLAQAGKGDSLRVRLETLDAFEIPDLAQLMQDDARAAGVTVDVQLRNSATYYEKYWLTSDFGITDYGHRGVPNVYLGAPLVSDGVWNAAQFSNARYDALVRSYTGALDLDEQRRYAREIQTLLLDETPVLIPYFYSYLYGTQRTATGMQATAMSHVDLTRAGLTA
jgi:peptide/nickel transport system substrate-binding protein